MSALQKLLKAVFWDCNVCVSDTNYVTTVGIGMYHNGTFIRQTFTYTHELVATGFDVVQHITREIARCKRG